MGRINRKILLIEDESPLALVTLRVLRSAGWNVSWANDGLKGLDLALTEDFGLVMLDVMLPGKNGWDICRELCEKKPSTSILMLTALDDVEDKVRGLQLGADDYLVKPFEVPELLARVESLIRRSQVSRDLVTRVADLELDRKTRTVTRQGYTIRLSRREYDLLEALASNEGLALDRETLQRRVWTDDEAFNQTVDVFVRTLKEKIDYPFGQELIHMLRDGSYILSDEPPCDSPVGTRILVA